MLSDTHYIAANKSCSILIICCCIGLGVENSFPIEKRRKYFYQKYYQLLLAEKFPMKEPKLCLVGPSDSGKTSWFYPFEGKDLVSFSILFCCCFHIVAKLLKNG